MTLEVYLPAALEEQINAFNSALGNHNVDYKTTTTGDIDILSIPYVSIDSESVISVDCLPYNASGDHVSGFNQFFKEFPIEILIRNNSDYQRHILISSNEDQTYGVSYSHTEVQSISSSSSVLKHYYFFTKDKITTLTDKTLHPVFYVSNRIEDGLINKRDCSSLTLSEIAPNLYYRILGSLLEVSEPVNTPIPSSLNYPTENVNNNFIYLTSIIVKSNNIPKTSVKTKLIGIADDGYRMNGNPLLSDRVCNYNFYLTTINQAYTNSSAYAIPLRPGELALLSSTIVSTQPHTNIGLLSETTFSFDEIYSRGLGRPFACFRLKIPVTGFKDRLSIDLPFRISTTNGVSWDILGYYTELTYSTDFKTDFVNYMRNKGLICYELPEDVFIIQNTTDSNYEFIFHYSNETIMETIGKDISTDDGSVIEFTQTNLPENFSICRTYLLDSENLPIDSRPKYLERPESYSLHIPPFGANDRYPSVFTDTVHYDIDLTDLQNVTEYDYTIDGVSTNVTIELEAESEETVLDKLVDSLTEELTNFLIIKTSSTTISIKCEFERSLKKFKLNCRGVFVQSGQSLFKEVDQILLRGL